jgi:hypothetical protein
MTKGRYDWGDGRGKAHSISLQDHRTNVKALHALGGNTNLTAPPTGVQAYREAQAAANAQFGPQVQAARQLQTNVAPWFNDFQARVAGYAQAAQAQAAPVLGQAQSYQQGAAAQLPPGLDPNSDAGQQAAQAASGRQALSQLGLDALNTQNTAAQNYFGGQQTIAAKEQPAAQTAAALRLAAAKSQRGAAVTAGLTTARQNAQNYNIAQGTLGLNTAKAQADAAQTQATTTERVRHDKASEQNSKAAQAFQRKQAQSTGYGAGRPGLNKYGFTYDQWTALSPKAQARARQGTGSSTTGPYGKLATPTQIGRARDAISQARSAINGIDGSRADIREALLTGRVQTGTKVVQQLTGRVVNGVPQKKMVSVPVYQTVPKIGALWLDVALDLKYDGGITSATAERLHRAGYLVGRLGFKPVRPAPLGTNTGT